MCLPVMHSQDAEDTLRLLRFFGIQGGLKCGGQGQNRTADTGIFSAVLYQLSYLAERKLSGVGPESGF